MKTEFRGAGIPYKETPAVLELIPAQPLVG